MASLRHILLFQQDVPRAARFLVHGLGLTSKVVTETYAELHAGEAVIAIKSIDSPNAAEMKSPALIFDVPDVQATLTQVLSSGDAEMDGPVQYGLDGTKVSIFGKHLDAAYVKVYTTDKVQRKHAFPTQSSAGGSFSCNWTPLWHHRVWGKLEQRSRVLASASIVALGAVEDVEGLINLEPTLAKRQLSRNREIAGISSCMHERDDSTQW